jgi:hypothetical protein
VTLAVHIVRQPPQALHSTTYDSARHDGEICNVASTSHTPQPRVPFRSVLRLRRNAVVAE